MDEQEKESEYLPKRIGIKPFRLRRKLSLFAKSIFVIALTLFSIAFRNTLNPVTIYNSFFTEPNITYNFAKYKIAGVVSYSGELINESSRHAKELTFKGKFNSKIIDLVITTSNVVEKNMINTPDGSVEFVLKRLSGKNKCQFDIIVDQQSEIIEQVQVSWSEKGKLSLIPQECDEKVLKGIKLREKVDDFYRKARRRWLENNAKNIR
jgi:hypothetical protein